MGIRHLMAWRSMARQLRPALLCLVLAAVGAQQLLARTHWHALPGPAAHAAASATVEAPADHGAPLRDADCLWCQAAAHAGAAPPPAATLRLIPAVELAFVRLPADAPADFSAPRTHAWHSRGPPAV